MEHQYTSFDFSKIENMEIVCLGFESGEVLLIFAENAGNWDEKAAMITLSKQQWEALQRLKPIEKAAKMAVGM